jgi:hypothetical protein
MHVSFKNYFPIYKREQRESERYTESEKLDWRTDRPGGRGELSRGKYYAAPPIKTPQGLPPMCAVRVG